MCSTGRLLILMSRPTSPLASATRVASYSSQDSLNLSLQISSFLLANLNNIFVCYIVVLYFVHRASLPLHLAPWLLGMAAATVCHTLLIAFHLGGGCWPHLATPKRTAMAYITQLVCLAVIVADSLTVMLVYGFALVVIPMFTSAVLLVFEALLLHKAVVAMRSGLETPNYYIRLLGDEAMVERTFVLAQVE